VVGVSEDPLTFRGDREGIRLARSAHVYLPRRRVTTTNDRVLVRTRGSAEEALATVSGALREVDPTQPVIAVETLRSIREEPMVLQTFLMRIFGPFAVCALAVALIGLYGLVGYEVALRRREMGVRAALGARGGTLLRLVLSDVLVLSAVGVVAGAALAGAAGELIGAFILFESPALSLAVYFGAASLVLATAALASAVPARLAAKADPVEALRGP
jgi:predicted lysophospholipase L1 biosynthesis ABC-type transport system permease subunit